MDPLETWVDESIAVSQRHGYNPTSFIEMRGRYGNAQQAMERLMQSGQIQSGLLRLHALGLAQEWSVEAGILRFPERFSRDAQDAARFRLDHIDDETLR